MMLEIKPHSVSTSDLSSYPYPIQCPANQIKIRGSIEQLLEVVGKVKQVCTVSYKDILRMFDNLRKRCITTRCKMELESVMSEIKITNMRIAGNFLVRRMFSTRRYRAKEEILKLLKPYLYTEADIFNLRYFSNGAPLSLIYIRPTMKKPPKKIVNMLLENNYITKYEYEELRKGIYNFASYQSALFECALMIAVSFNDSADIHEPVFLVARTPFSPYEADDPIKNMLERLSIMDNEYGLTLASSTIEGNPLEPVFQRKEVSFLHTRQYRLQGDLAISLLPISDKYETELTYEDFIKNVSNELVNLMAQRYRELYSFYDNSYVGYSTYNFYGYTNGMMLYYTVNAFITVLLEFFNEMSKYVNIKATLEYPGGFSYDMLAVINIKTNISKIPEEIVFSLSRYENTPIYWYEVYGRTSIRIVPDFSVFSGIRPIVERIVNEFYTNSRETTVRLNIGRHSVVLHGDGWLNARINILGNEYRFPPLVSRLRVKITHPEHRKTDVEFSIKDNEGFFTFAIGRLAATPRRKPYYKILKSSRVI